MSLDQLLSLFSPLDFAALFLLVAGAVWIDWRIESPPANRPSVSSLMIAFRRNWMRQMVSRDPRIFDAQLIGNLRQGTAFFASASMIAIGGGFAVIGNTDKLAGLINNLTHGKAPEIVWEIKILLVLLFLVNAFLKFVWAHRLYGYCAVLMAAVDNEASSPLALPRAMQAAGISNTAARSFNRAMRATYFSLAAVAWMLGPVPLLISTTLTIAVLYRREFASQSREIMLHIPPDTKT